MTPSLIAVCIFSNFLPPMVCEKRAIGNPNKVNKPEFLVKTTVEFNGAGWIWRLSLSHLRPSALQPFSQIMENRQKIEYTLFKFVECSDHFFQVFHQSSKEGTQFVSSYFSQQENMDMAKLRAIMRKYVFQKLMFLPGGVHNFDRQGEQKWEILCNFICEKKTFCSNNLHQHCSSGLYLRTKR